MASDEERYYTQYRAMGTLEKTDTQDRRSTSANRKMISKLRIVIALKWCTISIAGDDYPRTILSNLMSDMLPNNLSSSASTQDTGDE